MVNRSAPFTLGKAPANFTPTSPTIGGYIDGIDAALTGGGGGTPLSTQDEGIEVEPDTRIYNFTGAGVVAAPAGGNRVTVSIPGGGAGSSGFINVKDFGVVGDGVTDDTAALQAAYDAAIGKTLLYSDDGPYLVAGANGIGIPGPMIVLGQGAQINFTGANGCFRVSGTGLPFLKIYDQRVAYTGGSTGAIGRMGFVTTNNFNQGFNTDPAAGIDELTIEGCEFTSCKVGLALDPDDILNFHKNKLLAPNANVRMNPYFLHIRRANNGQGPRTFISENYIQGYIHDDGTINTGGGTPAEDNVDIIKWTAGTEATAPTNARFQNNYVENLYTLVACQMDIFFGGGGLLCTGNQFKNVIIHDKQDATGLPATVWSQMTYSQNQFEMTFNAASNSIQQRSNAPLFLRGGGLRIVDSNQFRIFVSQNPTNCIRLDNTILGIDTGFPNINTDAPVMPKITNNDFWLDGRTDHRFVDSDPAGATFTTPTLTLMGNTGISDAAQSVQVVLAASSDGVCVGNSQIGPGDWNLGGGISAANNVGITIV